MMKNEFAFQIDLGSGGEGGSFGTYQNVLEIQPEGFFYMHDDSNMRLADAGNHDLSQTGAQVVGPYLSIVQKNPWPSFEFDMDNIIHFVF